MHEFIKRINDFEFSYNDLSFEGVENIPYQVLLLNKKNRFKESLEYIIKKQIKKIEININLTPNELRELVKLPIIGLSLNATKNIDISCLNEMPNLQYLDINCDVYGFIDFNSLTKLMFLNLGAGDIELKNTTNAKNLKQLNVYNKKELPSLGEIGIENLQIYFSNMETLDCIVECTNLKKVVIEDCKKLTNIDALAQSAKTLNDLEIRNCKNIKNYTIMSDLLNLKNFDILNSGTLENAFIFENLNELKCGVINVKIENGNVDVLMNKPIIFKNHNHYNHKNNLKIKAVTNDGNYLMRGKEVLYKL